MQRTSSRLVIARAIAALTILLVAGRLADAQPPPTPASSADAALAAQQAAFLALPESTRKAAQDALVWLGFYNGVVDGDFGKRTRDALLAYQASVKAPTDGALSAPELKALLAAAEKARDAVGFQIVNDARTGASIGAPTKLISAHAGTKLDFAASSDADLDALYARLSAPTPSRRIAYKAIKPDAFFVVSGQDGTSTFYTRFDKNAAASPPVRGFTFAYPTARAAALDPVALAVANSFHAFPEAAKAGAGSAAVAAAAAASSAAVTERRGESQRAVPARGRLGNPYRRGNRSAGRGGFARHGASKRIDRHHRRATLRRTDATFE